MYSTLSVSIGLINILNKHSAAASLLVALLLGCTSHVPNPNDGTIKDGLYQNPFFHLSFQVPRAWVIENKPKNVDHFIDFYSRILAAGDKAESKNRVHHLIRVESLPIPLMGSQDAAITLTASYVEDKFRFSRYRARLIAHEMIDHPPIPMKIEKETNGIVMGGQEFDMIVFQIDLDKESFHEVIYTTIRKGYALVIGVVAKGEGGLSAGKRVLDSIRFDELRPKS